MFKTAAFILITCWYSASYGGSANVSVTISLSPQEQEVVRLYNFDMKSYQMVRSPFELTRQECLEYLPSQYPSAASLLDLHISKGRSPYRALTLVHFAIKANLSNKLKT